jgi:hypothetical protein
MIINLAFFSLLRCVIYPPRPYSWHVKFLCLPYIPFDLLPPFPSRVMNLLTVLTARQHTLPTCNRSVNYDAYS